MRERLVGFICVLAMLMAILGPCNAIAAPDSISEVSVSRVQGGFCFGIDINSQNISYESAHLIAGVYKKDGSLLKMACEKIENGQTRKDVTVNAFEGAYYYKIMLWAEEGNLRPICNAKEGVLAGDLVSTETSFAIVTQVTCYDEKEVILDYVCNGKKDTVKIGTYSLMQGDIAYNSITVGCVLSFIADKNGNATDYAVIAYADYMNKPLVSQAGVDAVSDADTEYVLGYIANEKYKATAKGEIIDLDNGETHFVSNSQTNQYTYDDSGRKLYIRTESFMDHIDMDYYNDRHGYTSKVFIKLVDGMMTDIYGFYDPKEN